MGRPLTRVGVERLIKKRRPNGPLILDGRDMSYKSLSGLNLKGASLIGADLSSCDLRGVDLTKANLSGANLVRADLRGAILDYATLSRVNIYRARGLVLASNFGSRGDTLYAWRKKVGPVVDYMFRTGCFNGDEYRFTLAVKNKYRVGGRKLDPRAEAYLALIKAMKAMLDYQYSLV